MNGGAATHYARALLQSLGRGEREPGDADDEHPAIAWARSGAMALTGPASGPPQLCPLPLASCADGALRALALLTGHRDLVTLRGAPLLGERAAIAGHRRAGAIAPGGSCRLLPARDGLLAVNLAREADWELLPAWLEVDSVTEWTQVSAALELRSAAALVERGRLLGLAVTGADPPPASSAWYSQARPSGSPFARPLRTRPPLVVDLSSLWAGPLCSHLLQLAGARVVKVESIHRPDGARRGPPAFFDLLNAGKDSVALDFDDAAQLARLRALLLEADIVIEAARPRALRQLGICAEQLVAQSPSLTWISITGYGRQEPEAQWIAFGDDAGVAAGLTWVQQQATGVAMFCGDAIADPLTGIHAALAAWHGYLEGGGGLISLSLREVVAYCIAFGGPCTPAEVRARAADWNGVLASEGIEVLPPRARRAAGTAAVLGADTQAVLTEFATAI